MRCKKLGCFFLMFMSESSHDITKKLFQRSSVICALKLTSVAEGGSYRCATFQIMWTCTRSSPSRSHMLEQNVMWVSSDISCHKDCVVIMWSRLMILTPRWTGALLRWIFWQMQNFSELSDLNTNNGYLKGKVPPRHLFLLTFSQLTTRKRAEHRIGVDLFHVKMPQLLGEETYHLVALREDCESRAPPFEAWRGDWADAAALGWCWCQVTHRVDQPNGLDGRFATLKQIISHLSTAKTAKLKKGKFNVCIVCTYVRLQKGMPKYETSHLHCGLHDYWHPRCFPAYTRSHMYSEVKTSFLAL